MPRKPTRLCSVALAPLLLAALASAADASPRERRAEACLRARDAGERQALACWRLQAAPVRGQRIHGGAAVEAFYDVVPADREAEPSKQFQRRRDWLRARARREAAAVAPR